MAQKRLRIFAGPNGSGKSTMLRQIKQRVPLGVYINADELEKLIAAGKGIKLEHYGIHTVQGKLDAFFKKSDFVKNKSNAGELSKTFTISNNIVQSAAGKISPKYSAAILAEFLRAENLEAGNDFSFETVMSHSDKLEFIKQANKKGYHVYLYFICTDDVRVNIERVKTRVKEGGHSVPEEKIRSRYSRTLDLLNDTLKICYKSYLFDNSDKFVEVARIDRDKRFYFSSRPALLPNWLTKYVLAKQLDETIFDTDL